PPLRPRRPPAPPLFLSPVLDCSLIFFVPFSGKAGSGQTSYRIMILQNRPAGIKNPQKSATHGNSPDRQRLSLRQAISLRRQTVDKFMTLKVTIDVSGGSMGFTETDAGDQQIYRE
ncbi:MAG: hypothetical protein KGR48_17525, partial [Alphaproteobacteria bacterium]|nr:hypothetical protein [Alphaproteobacteria bacterium]